MRTIARAELGREKSAFAAAVTSKWLPAYEICKEHGTFATSLTPPACCARVGCSVPAS